MAKIDRKTQKVFASSAPSTEIGKFGSLAAGSPTTSTDPDVIQALSNYLGGWFDAVVGSNSPAIEDMNGLCYLFAYQLAYIFQAGIAEWDSGTTYYIGSLANSAGKIYVSLVDDNLNNAVTDTTKWRSSDYAATTVDPAGASPYTLAAGDINKIFLVQSANGAMTFNLPAPALNYKITIKDRDGAFALNNCTLVRNGSETIEGLAASFVMDANYGEWTLISDGTNWFFVGK